MRKHVMGLGVGWRAPPRCWKQSETVERDRRTRLGESARLSLERRETRRIRPTTDGGSTVEMMGGVFEWTGPWAGQSPSHPANLLPVPQNGRAYGERGDSGGITGSDAATGKGCADFIYSATAGGAGVRLSQDWEVVLRNEDASDGSRPVTRHNGTRRSRGYAPHVPRDVVVATRGESSAVFGRKRHTWSRRTKGRRYRN